VASNRKTIIDAVVSACAGISGVKDASQEFKVWWNLLPHQYPRIIVMAEETDLERFAYLSSTDNDMQATMNITVTGYVFDEHNDLATKRTDLIKDIETAVVGDSTLSGLVLSVTPGSIRRDNGGLDNYSICDVDFEIEYLYNHASP